MAACKLMLDAARDVAGSSMVTAMARNGVEFGIQLSGTGDHWFVAPARFGLRRGLLSRPRNPRAEHVAMESDDRFVSRIKLSRIASKLRNRNGSK
jgi:hypothetical protein